MQDGGGTPAVSSRVLSGPSDRQYPPRRLAWFAALAATLTMTVSYIDRTAFAYLGPSVTKALGLTDTEFGWLVSAFHVAYLVATPLAGWWIDRIGARRGLLISVTVWSIVAALHCFVPGFGVLFLLRVMLGLAEGPSFPGSAQVIQRVLPPEEQSRGFGVLFTGSSIGGLLVPVITGTLVAWYDWRVALFGTAVIGLLWIPIWLLATRPPDMRKALAAAPSSVGERATFWELLAHPIMVRALIAVFAAAPIFGFALGWNTKYLKLTFDVAQRDMRPYLLLPPLAFDLGGIVFGDLASRQRRPEGVPPRTLFAIAIVPAACLGLLPFADSAWESIAFVCTAMAGAAALYALVTADLLSRMPRNSASFAAGIMAGAQSLALIIVNPLIGASVDYYGSYDVIAITLGFWVIPGSLIWLLWRPPVKFVRPPPIARVVEREKT